MFTTPCNSAVARFRIRLRDTLARHHRWPRFRESTSWAQSRGCCVPHNIFVSLWDVEQDSIPPRWWDLREVMQALVPLQAVGTGVLTRFTDSFQCNSSTTVTTFRSNRDTAFAITAKNLDTFCPRSALWACCVQILTHKTWHWFQSLPPSTL